MPEWYPSESDPSAGVFVRDQARAASRANAVTVLVHDPRPRRRGDAAVSDGIEEGLRTIRIRTRARPGTTAGRIAFLFAAARVLRSLSARGEGPDVIHAHVFSAGLQALLLSRGRWPVVVSEHHSDFIEGKVRGRDAVVAHLVLKHADLVCPVSASLKAHMEAFEPSGRYEVVPNVVDVDQFTTAPQRGRARTGTTRLLVAATLAPQKGIEYLLDALVEVHRSRTDFTLDVVGDGPSRNELESIARERLPPGVVTFHGMLPRAEVAAFMARSDVFVLPSIVETFGVALIEALAAGLPIITTRAVPGHERLGGQFGIIVPAHDPAALRDAVLAMLDRPWPVPTDAGAELARSFAEPVLSRRWDEVYRAVAPRR
jgi:glycosyltransferase involved in cell wall biosynthesis